MANKKYKILVPKPVAVDEQGMDVQLMTADSVVEADTEVMSANMQSFVENGWAIEVKMDSVDETVEVEAEVEAEVKRARNDKGQLVGDDPDTPDVNEAWEGGKAPKTTAKKSTKKKSTKKSK